MDLFENIDPRALIPHPDNSRTHADAQITRIEQFGFNGALTIDEGNVILAGHGRCLAALRMNLPSIPCVRRVGLSDAQKRAFVIADNKIALDAEWDTAVLAAQLESLRDTAGLDLDSLGIGELALASIADARPADAAAVAALEAHTDSGPATEQAFEREMADARATGLLPIVPMYAEHHEAFVIVCDNAVDEAWLRNLLGLEPPMRSYKDVKFQRANVLTVQQLRERLA